MGWEAYGGIEAPPPAEGGGVPSYSTGEGLHPFLSVAGVSGTG